MSDDAEAKTRKIAVELARAMQQGLDKHGPAEGAHAGVVMMALALTVVGIARATDKEDVEKFGSMVNYFQTCFMMLVTEELEAHGLSPVCEDEDCSCHDKPRTH